MRTKAAIAIGLGILLGIVATLGLGPGRHGGIVAGAPASAAAKQYWTCGMHPQVHLDHPGNCPICGMKLVPERRTQGDGEANPNVIAIDPVTVQNMGVRTELVTRGPLRRVVRTVGVVDYDEGAVALVTTKYRGWIEKVYANRTGQFVRQGDPLFEIYAPELYSAQTEYLLALQHAGDPATLLASARTKLKFFDISDERIAELEKSRQASKTMRVNAPRDGVVMEKMLVEGQMIEAGMPLYRLGGLDPVWVLGQVYEQDLPAVKLGQEAAVSLAYRSGQPYRGRVAFVYPTIDERTRAGRVRLEFPNPDQVLKPGMYVSIQIVAELAAEAVLAPELAVLRSGETNSVFVALGNGHFEPRQVSIGARGEGGYYQVIEGLRAGETVVTSAQFLLDSESQLRGATQKMTPPVAPPAASAPAAPAENALAKPWYVCPMPEHADIHYEKPGDCPRCGMKLVPVPKPPPAVSEAPAAKPAPSHP